jgi:KDO2-lipid IV(A) lauroyltransferase
MAMLEKHAKGIHKSPMARRIPRKPSPVKKFFYRLRYRAGAFSLRAFVTILPWIPYRWLVLFVQWMSWVTFQLGLKYRSRMEANVAMALGNEFTNASERRRLVWRAWKNFARGILDTTTMMHFSKDKIIDFVAIEGEVHLQRALAKGKGVLALSAHLGGFTLIGARLAAAGYPFSVVVKQPGDERFARLVDGYRAQLGIDTISAKPRRQATRGILKALRENRIVLVIADEFKSGGLMVNFLGQESPAPRGPATLALRTGAATLPMFATRRPDGSLLLKIAPEVELIKSADLEESVVATTKLFTRYLEDAIRCYPDQWNWLGFRSNGKVGPGVRRRRRRRRRASQFTGSPH